MSLFIEKYDSTRIFHRDNQIMTRMPIPGLYFWTIVAPAIAIITLGIAVNPELLGLLIFIPLVAFFGYAFLYLIFDLEYEPHGWRMFNRRRIKFYSSDYNRLDHSDAGPEFKAKLKQYLDLIRKGERRDTKVEGYLVDVYNAEQIKIREYESLVPNESKVQSVVDMSLIERLNIESEELRKVQE